MAQLHPMFHAAICGAALLGELAAPAQEFIWNAQMEDGSFRDSTGVSCVMSTVFGVECLLALGAVPPWNQLKRYCDTKINIYELDIFQLASLPRLWRHIPGYAINPTKVSEMATRLREFYSEGGGYGVNRFESHGTIAATYMAIQAFMNLKLEIFEKAKLIGFVQSLENPGGGWADHQVLPLVTMRATGGGIGACLDLGITPSSAAAAWIMARLHKNGGFCKTAGASVPDAVSTAWAMWCMEVLGHKVPQGARDKTMDFLDSLWNRQGSFYRSCADHSADCESTFHALVALSYCAS